MKTQEGLSSALSSGLVNDNDNNRVKWRGSIRAGFLLQNLKFNFQDDNDLSLSLSGSVHAALRDS